MNSKKLEEVIMLKLELKRGLKRKTFIVALLVTTIFCVVQH